MRIRTTGRLVALAAASTLLFAACGSKSTPATEAATETEAVATETTAAAAAETTAAVAETAAAESVAETAAAESVAADSAAAAGGNEATPGIAAPDLPAATAVGDGEGALNLIAWAGYTEKDWVGPFEIASNCKVNVKTGNSSDEMVQLIKSGEYDGVSASGDASLRLIAAGDVAPVNTDLIPNYKDVFEGLKGKPWSTVGGKAYGVPHGRGANLLMYNVDAVTPAPDSWSVVFDPASPFKGKITAYDAPIYIADAAVYLMSTKPELGITNPYALDEAQFAASVALLKEQKTLVGEYWSDFTKQIAGFKTGSMVAGTAWQVTANVAIGDKQNVAVVKPKEGTTGWSDTWMIAAKAKNPNCMYKWMDYIISPEANAMATEYFGEAPSNKLSCAKTKDPNHCTTFHADDEEYFKDIWYWTTPTKECLDGRGSKCVPFGEWVNAWTEIKG
jgi:putative spermidine/putrescine transport system substrate-binding protein